MGRFILCTEMQRKCHRAEIALEKGIKGVGERFKYALVLITALYQNSAHTCTNKIAKTVLPLFQKKKK